MFLHVPLAVILLAGLLWVVARRRGGKARRATHLVLLQRVAGLRQHGHARPGLKRSAKAFEALVPAARAKLRRKKAYFRKRSEEDDEPV
jgi:hypothetical protein